MNTYSLFIYSPNGIQACSEDLLNTRPYAWCCEYNEEQNRVRLRPPQSPKHNSKGLKKRYRVLWYCLLGKHEFIWGIKEVESAVTSEGRVEADSRGEDADSSMKIADCKGKAEDCRRKHTDSRQKHASSRQKYADSRGKHADSRQKHAGSRQTHADSKQKHADIRQKYEGSRQKHACMMMDTIK